MRFALLTLAVITAASSACGGFPKPEARISSSEAAIRGAKEAGAPSVPAATLHLKLAEEEHDKAMALIKDGDNEKADFMLMRSEADAELANALAREATAKAETAKTQEQVEKLKKKAAGK